MSYVEGSLVLSDNRGRYAVGHATNGPDLSSGRSIQVFLDGRWASGVVEYYPDSIYASMGPQTLEEVPLMAERPKAIAGYYFAADGGGICGLCVGMKVRVF